MLARRRAAPDEATSDLAARASERTLASAGLRPDQIGLIVSATSLPDELGPSVACRVQSRIGARDAAAMDVGAACSGFLYALEVARCWLLSRPGAPPALVVGAEVYSRSVDPAVFLCSPAAAFVTGQYLAVDGGLSAFPAMPQPAPPQEAPHE